MEWDPLAPFQGSRLSASSSSQYAQNLNFQRIKTLDDLQQAVEVAKRRDQSVMVDFYADWCITCIEMEHDTFSVAAVQQSLDDVLLLQADVTQNDADDQQLLKHFNLFGPPAILFFDTNGIEQPGYRLVGFVKAKAFIEHVEQVKSL